ncbi:MAG: pyruvate:ferredoxin (flavodoxin) oxidoreductase [Verrucomicrobiota bacterium]
MNEQSVTVDGCEAAAGVAYKASEVIIIYPITPSSPIGEFADAWAAEGEKNLWGNVPLVQEMQSEGGAAGSVHGALQAGSLSTTFTASQGLLLMIPNMYKIAGELTSAVFHVTARSLATSALSIFGDHSDVMAVRATGWGILFSNSVQEAADMALIAHSATLQARIPFVHAFDGFRTSHEVMKITPPADEAIRAMIDDDLVRAHRARALSPDHPVIRGTAQNPDVCFQSREAVNPYYIKTPEIVQKTMAKFGELTGRQYNLFDYVGTPDAERVVVAMGSGCEAIQETVEYLLSKGEKIGMIKVRLFRPFSAAHLTAALPQSVRSIAVLDRTKEPGAAGEPLYQDVITALFETGRTSIRVIGGRYGISSKEFTSAMAKAVFDEMKKDNPKNHFSVGVIDDVTHNSLDVDASFQTESDDCVRCVFWGLGADGTVGANKNSIKIIGEETDFYAQGYFVYDSKKSGARTVSHLRFGPKPIHSTYLIPSANFVAIHQFNFLESYPVLDTAAQGATVLLNAPYSADQVWDKIPKHLQKVFIDKKLKLYVVDAYQVAKDTGMGGRMNTILQTCFFAISKVLPTEQAIACIKQAIHKTYGKRGEAVVQKNITAVDAALAHLHEVKIPENITGPNVRPIVSPQSPEFVRNVTAQIMAEHGDMLPVSAMPADGTFPTGTSQWEKRGLALDIPVWDSEICIQCGKCVMVCPHSCIRSKIFDSNENQNLPEGFLSCKAKWKEIPDAQFTIQVAGEDCTGCTLCTEVCPAKNKTQEGRKAINMASYAPIKEHTQKTWEAFVNLKEHPLSRTLPLHLVRNAQTRQPLFEFSGACAGCGETPYIRILSQLYGDRALIANATGCSSIYGGNLPTTPWTFNNEGRGPAWSNSLFEDNAEFGFGMRLAVNQQNAKARALLMQLSNELGGDSFCKEILDAPQTTDSEITKQRERISALKQKLSSSGNPLAKELLTIADALVKKSVWIVGGDGWAYDIGYGGLDHVLAQGQNVNVLVLDTQVYSNTGGQSSKATPLGAVAKFAAAGKRTPRKDLGLIAVSYGSIYVAQIAMGADDAHALRAIQEAEAYDGSSLIIAYSHCIAHGIQMNQGLHHQKLAVQSGAWPLYRYNPMLAREGKNPFTLDSKPPTIELKDYIMQEGRFRVLHQSHPEAAQQLLELAQADVRAHWSKLEYLAAQSANGSQAQPAAATVANAS